MGLLLFGLALSSCSSSSLPRCAQCRPRDDRFPFLALEAMTSTREVTVFGDAKARSGIDKSYVDAAVAMWNDACRQKLYIPHFVVDWEHDRPPVDDSTSPIYRTTIGIVFLPDDPPPPPDTQTETETKTAEVAKWIRDDNSIKVFGKCDETLETPCEEDSILWNSRWGSMIIAHEIGHALGLWHDDSPKCKEYGLMQAQLNKKKDKLPILLEYCSAVDDINNEKSACNSGEYDWHENPCNYVRIENGN